MELEPEQWYQEAPATTEESSGAGAVTHLCLLQSPASNNAV